MKEPVSEKRPDPIAKAAKSEDRVQRASGILNRHESTDRVIEKLRGNPDAVKPRRHGTR